MFDFDKHLAGLAEQTVLCVGDLMLDEFVYGEVSRISPEAPTPVLAVKRSEVMVGGAGNVARNLVSLGTRCIFVGVVGDDDAGKALTEALTTLPLIEFHLVVDPEHSDDLAYRTNFSLLGAVEDTYIYTAEPAPAFNVAPPGHLASVASGIAGSEFVVDGRTTDNNDGGHVAVFEVPGSQIAVGNGANVIGVRLWGQGATDWLLGCVRDDGTTAPAGQVHIAGGDGAQSGDAFVRSISACRTLTVTPSGNSAGTWLSEIQLLTGK